MGQGQRRERSQHIEKEDNAFLFIAQIVCAVYKGIIKKGIATVPPNIFLAVHHQECRRCRNGKAEMIAKDGMIGTDVGWK